MLFVFASYGDNYIPFLSVALDSLLKEQPNDNVNVLWADTSIIEVNLLKIAFPSVNFIQEPIEITHYSEIERIPIKLRMWASMCRRTTEEYICFLDTDIIVLKNISKYLDRSADFIYTWKKETFPINAGVIIVRTSEKVSKFLELWSQKSDEILHNKEQFEEARNKNGGANQHSLVTILKKINIFEGGKVDFEFGTLKFKGIPCKELNQTNSVPINSGSHILHYKGGWRPIILENAGYTTNRSKETSHEMKEYWEERYKDFNERLLSKTFKDLTLGSLEEKFKDLGVTRILRVSNSELGEVKKEIEKAKNSCGIIISGKIGTKESEFIKSLILECNNIKFIYLENVKYLEFDKNIDRLYKFESSILILPNTRDRFKLISTTSSNWLSKLASFRSSSH